MDPISSTAGAHIGSTLIVVGTMQWLKNSKWFPLLTEGRKALNRIVSICAAGAIQLGISFQWSANGSGGHTLLTNIPALSVIAIGLFHWACQFIYQETGYQVMSGLLALKAIAGNLSSAMVPTGPRANADAAVQVAPIEPVK